MFVMQRLVIVVIFDPVTPGGLRASMDWSKASSSATEEDIVLLVLGPGVCLGQILSVSGIVALELGQGKRVTSTGLLEYR